MDISRLPPHFTPAPAWRLPLDLRSGSLAGFEVTQCLSFSGLFQPAGFLAVCVSVCLMEFGLFTPLHFPGDSHGRPENTRQSLLQGQAPDVDFPDTWWPLVVSRTSQFSPVLGALPGAASEANLRQMDGRKANRSS